MKNSTRAFVYLGISVFAHVALAQDYTETWSAYSENLNQSKVMRASYDDCICEENADLQDDGKSMTAFLKMTRDQKPEYKKQPSYNDCLIELENLLSQGICL